ncbi:MAG: hypothetical protein LC737_04050, partial [Chloroflexi bacterium]|nr:hypothetical protein [Chloroflexota bacterium]
MVRQVQKALTIALLLCSAMLLYASIAVVPAADARVGVPTNNSVVGLVFDGLERRIDGACNEMLTVQLATQARALCTHGPDAPPTYHNVALSVAPLTTATSAPSASVTCAGDGVSGRRVQVLYAHASDVPDQYATYLASFQQWVADADNIFHLSALETGGDRHMRFVHDANCTPNVLNVTLSPTGDDTFGSLFNELQALGFTRADRNYLLFVDAHVYCG